VTTARAWAPILADLRGQTGLKVRASYALSQTQLVSAMRAGQIDVGWFSNQAALEAIDRRGRGEVFARTVGLGGVDGYSAVLIVSVKQPVTLERVLRCDRTLTFGMGEALSTSGALAPMTYFFAPRNIDPTRCFKSVSIASPGANLSAVASEGLDIATTNSTALVVDRRMGGHEASKVKVIWRSPLLPQNPIVWRKDLDPAVKEKVRQFFLTYGEGEGSDAIRERRNLERVSVGGFKPADNNHLLPVREMQATERLIEARQGHDVAATTKAAAALEEIVGRRTALEARTRAPAAAQ
jgi:phosphonate transport system substrate-binding protein